MVKMDDIAQLAGVSKASVSRVINNKAVSPAIRERVEKIINELHYQPNLIAQSLTTKTTNVIGLIIPNRSNYYINTYDFITTCIDLLAESGKVAIVVEMDDSASSFIDSLNKLMVHQCDGIIYYHSSFINVDFNSKNIRTVLDNLRKPIAILNKKGEQQAEKYFWFDNEKIASLAAEYLLSNGHEKIAYLSAPLSEETARTRVSGVKNAIEKHNKAFLPTHFSEGTRDIDGGYSACRDLFRKTRDVTGLLCFNDAMALGAVKYLSEINEIAHSDISIVGIGADPLINKIYPSLVTVYTPLRELIANAVSYVLGENMEVLETELPGTLYIDERIKNRSNTNLFTWSMHT